MNATSGQPARYLLWTPFFMPTAHGPVRAIAVTTRDSRRVQSLYTLLLQTIVIQIWVLIVLLVMKIVTRRLKVTHNIGVANVAVWNSQYSPLSIAWSMLSYGTLIPGYALMWSILAVLAFSGQILVSSFVSPHLIVGQAAPVNPQAVFVPELAYTASNATALLDSAVRAPANLRAVGALNAVDPFTGNEVSINDATNNAVHFNRSQTGFTLQNEPIYQFDYCYNVTGSDFGLQRAQSLIHMVQGSCYTEYHWYQEFNSTNDTNNYLVPCGPYLQDCPQYMVTNKSVSKDDAKAPIVNADIICPDNPPQSNNSINATFLFSISSVGRRSYTVSNDPWFLTEEILDNTSGYRVSSGRPFLNCWQQDSWSYNGQTRPINTLDELGALSPGLLNIFKTFLGAPRIMTLTTGLGASALKAAETGSLGVYFDAETSSVANEMLRLVSAAYIATKNTFAETTVSDNSQYPNLPNSALDATTDSILDGTGDFVVFGAGLAALSLSFLVSVPLVLLLLLLTMFFLHSNLFVHWPWADLNAMNATILYSTIDSKSLKDEVAWKRSSSSPYHEVDEQALVRPKYDKADRSYGWSRVLEVQGTNHPLVSEKDNLAIIESRMVDSSSGEGGPEERGSIQIVEG